VADTIKIWNWHTGQCISTLAGHADGVISVHFDSHLLASGSIDKCVRIFNFDTKKVSYLKGHSDWVNCTRLDINSRTVFSASDDTTIKLWDLDTEKAIRTYEGHVGHVQQVLPMPLEYEPDDEILNPPKGSANDNADTYSVTSSREDTGTMVSFFPPPERCSSPPSADQEIRAMYGPAFVADPSRPLPPRYFLTSGLDSTIRLWDSATGKSLKTMFGHLEGVWSLAGDTIRLTSAGNDGMVKVWEPRSGKCENTFTGHKKSVMCVGLSDSLLVSGGEEGEIRVCSFKDVDTRWSDAGSPK